MATYRAAVIGTGGVARNRHIPAMLASGRTELAALADVSQEALSKCAPFGAIPAYLDYREMLRQEKPSVVSVCTRAGSHCQIVVDCARAGVRGVLCEKPMARNLREAETMIAECETQGAKLAIGHQRRYKEQHQFAKQLIDRGELGRLVALWGSCPPHLIEWGTHYVDLMLWYAGDVDFVMGQISGAARPGRGGYPEPDPAIGYLHFKSGAIGVLETNLVGRKDDERPRVIHVRGERGEAEVMVDGGLKYCTAESPAWISPRLAPRDGFLLEIENLCDCMESGQEPLDSGRDGMKALGVLLAILESARLRGKVALPLAQKENPLELLERESK
ncbi:MAG: Gfo/Idh/MocA family oxidoreductase [Candidatus Sumerlaeota bacterium]|nr:Gfo/Idh/MocA family oxidoreductase [Candidatus Sumerlaeota bacterium]